MSSLYILELGVEEGVGEYMMGKHAFALLLCYSCVSVCDIEYFSDISYYSLRWLGAD